MQLDFSKGHPPIPEKYEDWTTYYKAYPRLPKIDADKRPSTEAQLFDGTEVNL